MIRFGLNDKYIQTLLCMKNFLLKIQKSNKLVILQKQFPK